MGTWGVGSFENDAAQEWIAALCTARDGAFLVSTLSAVRNLADEYLDAPDAAAAIAASEVVAALHGAPGSPLPPDAEAWVSARSAVKVSDELLETARQVVHRVRTDSELKDLWEESNELDRWLAMLADLESRLRT